MSKIAVAFIVAIGIPRPMHKLLVKNWELVKNMDFVILTDNVAQWSSLLSHDSNIFLKKVTVDELFYKSSVYLGSDNVDDFMCKFGDRFFNRVDGWSVCGFRPLFRELFPEFIKEHKYWGWMDWDVVINPLEITRVLKTDSDILLLPLSFIAWEQFKLFNVGFDEIYYYKKFLNTVSDFVAPMEAKLCYWIRDEKENFPKITELKQEEVGPHWSWTNIHYKNALVNQCDVNYYNDGKLMSEQNHELVFLIADTQVKKFNSEQTDIAMESLENYGTYRFEYVQEVK